LGKVHRRQIRMRRAGEAARFSPLPLFPGPPSMLGPGDEMSIEPARSAPQGPVFQIDQRTRPRRRNGDLVPFQVSPRRSNCQQLLAPRGRRPQCFHHCQTAAIELREPRPRGSNLARANNLWRETTISNCRLSAMHVMFSTDPLLQQSRWGTINETKADYAMAFPSRSKPGRSV